MGEKATVNNKTFSKENMLHLWNKIKNRFTDTEKKMNMIKVFMEKYYASPSGTATYTATISEWNGLSKYELIGKSFVGIINDTSPFPVSNELIIRVNDNAYNVVTTGGRQLTSLDGYNLSNPMVFVFKSPDTLELRDGSDIGNINGLLSILPNNMVGAINTTYNHAQKVENDVKSINNKRLESMEQINLTTESGFFAGALAVKELGMEVGKNVNYIKFANGVLIQWGNVDQAAGGTATSNVNLYLPYKENVDYAVIVTPQRNGSIVEKYWIGDQGGNNINKTNKFFQISSLTNNVTNYGKRFNWVTIGFWK